MPYGMTQCYLPPGSGEYMYINSTHVDRLRRQQLTYDSGTFVDVIEKSINASGLTSHDCSQNNTVNTSTPRNCYDIHKSGERSDGVYTVYPNDTESGVEVYCDMTTDGVGWTVCIMIYK